MPKSNRKAVEAFIIEQVEKILPGGGNGAIYRDFFSKMSDAEFDKWMMELGTKQKRLFIIAPNMGKVKLNVERNLKLNKALGGEIEHQLIIPKEGDIPSYITPKKYPVFPVYLRRQSQLLTKKASIPKAQNTTDMLTGQPVNKSKGSSMSAPEIDVLLGRGLKNTALEFMKYRGGDIAAKNALEQSFRTLGSASITDLNPRTDRPESVKTLSILFTCMHIRNTL